MSNSRFRRERGAGRQAPHHEQVHSASPMKKPICQKRPSCRRRGPDRRTSTALVDHADDAEIVADQRAATISSVTRTEVDQKGLPLCLLTPGDGGARNSAALIDERPIDDWRRRWTSRRKSKGEIHRW